MPYNLWTAEYHGGGPRNHIRLFLETEANGDGGIYHVIGSILNGMSYERRPDKKLDESATYVPDSATRIGSIEDVDRLEAVCQSVPPPEAQMRLNGSKLYPNKPLRRCGEWVQEVIEELRQQQILHI